MKANWEADEMEMSINYKAARNGYVFCIVSLLIYSIYDFIQTGRFGNITFLILVLAGVIFYITKFILTHNLIKSGDEDEE